MALSENIRFDKPTLFIRGGNSGYITEEDQPLIFQHFPNAKIRTIKGAGHWVHAEKMDEFYDAVLQFL